MYVYIDTVLMYVYKSMCILYINAGVGCLSSNKWSHFFMIS